MLNSIRSEDASIEDRRLRVRALLDIIKERKHDVSSQVGYFHTRTRIGPIHRLPRSLGPRRFLNRATYRLPLIQ